MDFMDFIDSLGVIGGAIIVAILGGALIYALGTKPKATLLGIGIVAALVFAKMGLSAWLAGP